MIEPKNASPEDVIEVITVDDYRLKLIGEFLSNETARAVLNIVLSGCETASGIAQRLDLSLPLALYHLDRLVNLGLLNVKEIDRSSKGRDIKRYSVSKMAFLIVPSPILENKKETISRLRRSAMKAFLKRILYSLMGFFVAFSLSLSLLPRIFPPIQIGVDFISLPGHEPIEIIISTQKDALPISMTVGLTVFTITWLFLTWRARR